MIRGWFWCGALLVSAFLASWSVARANVGEDHAADEHGHGGEDETVNNVSPTILARTHAVAEFSISLLISACLPSATRRVLCRILAPECK